MNRQQALLLAATLPAGMALTACGNQTKPDNPTRPNIIYILADDMGAGDLRVYNSHSRIPTPALDSMAAQGIVYTDAHSNSAVSTPTRYGTLTGRYAFRSALKKGVLTGYSAPLIEPGRETVASLLQRHSYQTACIGKWHLGLNWVKKDASKPLYIGDEWNVENTENIDYTATINGGPTDCGFTYSCILPASLDMCPYVYIENGKITAPVNGYTPQWADPGIRGAWYRNGDVADDFKHRECLEYFTRKAEEFIQKASAANEPYFLYFPLTAPHTPWLPSAEFEGKSEAGAYGDFVCMVDEVVRRIYQAVSRGGKAENTLIIFTSDNGSMWTADDIRETQHLSNGCWNGKKADIWEGGHRIPLLATWPAAIKSGQTSAQLVCATDLMATLAQLVGEEHTPADGEDSYSFAHTFGWKASVTYPIRESMIHHSVNGNFALRRSEWVLVDCKGSGGWTLPEEEADKLPPHQLYHLKADTAQQRNLASAEPERVRAMKAELAKLIQASKTQ